MSQLPSLFGVWLMVTIAMTIFGVVIGAPTTDLLIGWIGGSGVTYFIFNEEGP